MKIVHGCCMEEIKNIPSKSIDAIICDLPYGVTRNKWDSVLPMSILWSQYKRVIKDNGIIILFAQGLFSANLMLSNKEMYRYSLVWEKTTPTGFLNANRQPLRSHEDILIFYKKQPTYNPIKTTGHKRKISSSKAVTGNNTANYGAHGAKAYDSTERFPKSVLKFATDKQKEAFHPTQKPVALLEYLIKAFTNEGDLILDNTAGSGTTGVAAQNTNRKCILIEKEKKYIDIINKRLTKTE
jgi:DNA modification methylase